MPSQRNNDRIGVIVLVQEIYCDKCGAPIEGELVPDGYALPPEFDPDNPDLCMDCLNKEIQRLMMDS